MQTGTREAFSLNNIEQPQSTAEMQRIAGEAVVSKIYNTTPEEIAAKEKNLDPKTGPAAGGQTLN